jgi:hypothetical protein
VADAESLEMNVMLPIETLDWSSFRAVIIGPMVFVCKWNAKSSYELASELGSAYEDEEFSYISLAL